MKILFSSSSTTTRAGSSNTTSVGPSTSTAATSFCLISSMVGTSSTTSSLTTLGGTNLITFCSLGSCICGGGGFGLSIGGGADSSVYTNFLGATFSTTSSPFSISAMAGP